MQLIRYLRKDTINTYIIFASVLRGKKTWQMPELARSLPPGGNIYKKKIVWMPEYTVHKLEDVKTDKNLEPDTSHRETGKR